MEARAEQLHRPCARMIDAGGSADYRCQLNSQAGRSRLGACRMAGRIQAPCVGGRKRISPGLHDIVSIRRATTRCGLPPVAALLSPEACAPNRAASSWYRAHPPIARRGGKPSNAVKALTTSSVSSSDGSLMPTSPPPPLSSCDCKAARVIRSGDE